MGRLRSPLEQAGDFAVPDIDIATTCQPPPPLCADEVDCAAGGTSRVRRPACGV